MKLSGSIWSKARRESGISLVELMIALGIGTLLLTAMASFAVYTSRNFVATGNYADLDRASRAALDGLTRDIRQARSMTSYQTNKIVLKDYYNNTLTYTWDPSASTLSRKDTNGTVVILQQCDYLKFGISQRNPSNNFTFYPALNSLGQLDPTMAKLVDVSWLCSRKILGRKVNTESVQTAKIVMRN